AHCFPVQIARCPPSGKRKLAGQTTGRLTPPARQIAPGPHLVPANHDGCPMTALPSTMISVRKLRNEPGLWLENDTPVPAIGPREVLVAVTHAGICGTDRHIYEWDAWSRRRVKVGITVGHEFVGRVAAIGSAVTRAAVGQRVSAEGHIGCGVCQPCRTGNGHI